LLRPGDGSARGYSAALKWLKPTGEAVEFTTLAGGDRHLKDGNHPHGWLRYAGEGLRRYFCRALWRSARSFQYSRQDKEILMGMRFKRDLYAHGVRSNCWTSTLCPLKGVQRRCVDFVVIVKTLKALTWMPAACSSRERREMHPGGFQYRKGVERVIRLL